MGSCLVEVPNCPGNSLVRSVNDLSSWGADTAMMPPDPDTIALSEVEDPRTNQYRWGRNLVLVLVGGGFLTIYIMAFAMPLANALYALNWRPTPCTLLESTLQEHSDDEGGTTYSLAIKYGYYATSVSDNRAPTYWESTRYNFQSGSDSDRDYWSELANLLRPGNACTCFVDPVDPSQAALNVSLGRPLWNAILWSPFAAIPLVLPWLWWREKKRPVARWRAQKRWSTKARDALKSLRSRTSLRGGDTVIARLTEIALGLVFSVGFGVAACALMTRPFAAGNASALWWITVPFGLLFGAISLTIGFALLAGVFAPRLLLELEQAKLLLGQTAQLRYRVKGKPPLMSTTKVSLLCNYVIPDSDSPDERFPLYEMLLVERDSSLSNLEECCVVVIPADGPCTIKQEFNRIEWEVRFELIPSFGTGQRASLVFPVESEPFRLQATRHPLNGDRCEQKPPMELQLEPSAPGVLSGHVSWNLTQPVSSIDLRLFWYTEDQSQFRPVNPVAATTVSALQCGGCAPFSLQIPATPRPYQSDKITVAWALEAIARPSGIVRRLDLIRAEPSPDPSETRCRPDDSPSGVGCNPLI